jgi:hypothetical protein
MRRVEDFENHRAGRGRGETRETCQRFRNQETLNHILLSVEIGAEIESTICRVEIRRAGGDGEGILIGQMIEIAGGVRAVGDRNGGMFVQKGGGLSPSRDCTFSAAERHGRHRNWRTDTIQNRL